MIEETPLEVWLHESRPHLFIYGREPLDMNELPVSPEIVEAFYLGTEITYDMVWSAAKSVGYRRFQGDESDEF